MKRFLIPPLLLIAIFACNSALLAVNQYRVSNVDGGMPYLLHLPEVYHDEPTREFPAIIYLHGYGERCENGTYGTTSELHHIENAGNTPPNHTRNGHSMKFTVDDQEEYFIVISPQIRKSRGDWNAEDVVALLDEISSEYRIDADRVYLTGFSFGGQGTWNVLTGDANTPNRFAAAAIVAGRSLVANRHSKIADDNVAVWSMSGLSDPTEHTPERVLSANNTLRSFFPDAEHLVTMYPNYSHSSSRQYNTGHTYHDPNIYEWFLTKKRQRPGKPDRVNLSNRAATIATSGDEESPHPAIRVKNSSGSYWASSTDDYEKKWVQLDLGETFMVDQVFVRFSWSTSASIKPVAPKGSITSIEASPTAGRIRVHAPYHNRRTKIGSIAAHQIYLKDTGTYDGGPYDIHNERDYNRENGWFEIEADYVGDSTGTWYALNETVAAYTIYGSVDGNDWFPLANVEDNYEFSRQHKFDATSLRYVRLNVTDPNRTDLAEHEHRAKVYEMVVLEAYNPPNPPTPPSGLVVADVTSGGVSLAWSGASGMVDQYQIYWSTTDTQPETPQATVGFAQNAFTAEGLLPNTEYFFWVSASNAGGESSATSISQRTEILTTPIAPTNFTASGATATSVSLSWQDNADNESGYNLYWATDAKPALPNQQLSTDSSSTLISGLTPDTRYTFWLEAKNAAGTSDDVSATATTSAFEGSLSIGLISRWKFDEQAGSTAFDSTGFNDAILSGETARTDEAVAGHSISLDGTDDWVEAPHQEEYSSSAMSVSMWVRPSLADSQPRGLISKRQGLSASQRCFSIFTHTNSYINLDIGNQRFTTNYSLNEIGTWKHLVMTYDGAQTSENLKLYIDGSQVAESTISTTSIPSLTCPVTIGTLNTNYGSAFAGQIDEVRIYNRALTVAEVEALHETEPFSVNETPDTFTEWAALNLGNRPIAEQSPTSDPDHDGIPNLLEYAQASNPTDNASVNLPYSTIQDSSNAHYLEFSYRRLQGGNGSSESGYTANNLLYTVLISHDLTANSWVTGVDHLEFIPPSIEHGDNSETVTVRVKQSIESAAQTFIRLQIEELN
ncbi:LamG-like jellyroll fold domain-containing protein [Cerasicoccus fimbriatus]|uniref:LamG-like jellyroll fold domain-containing protein n=1 Tax=Cerasicoccus fimbriatus TaxID=3014554 RepID=UPI0022B2D103|nr:LamG-like jellyroll fold domain-containing protein [Cerasicoccus sp. TK19100]